MKEKLEELIIDAWDLKNELESLAIDKKTELLWEASGSLSDVIANIAEVRDLFWHKYFKLLPTRPRVLKGMRFSRIIGSGGGLRLTFGVCAVPNTELSNHG